MSQISLTSRYTPDGIGAQHISLSWTPSGPVQLESVSDCVLVWVYLAEILDTDSNNGISYEDLYETSISGSTPSASEPIDLVLTQKSLSKAIEKALLTHSQTVRDAWWYVYVGGLTPYYASLHVELTARRIEEIVPYVTDAIQMELENADII